MVEINTKTDLLKEIEAFSKALYEYRNIGPLIISEKEYNPYYVENGYLKRADYSGVILDENAFLAFYAVFFDSIKLDSNAGKISDSNYFNTLYYKYKAKYEKESSNLDPFMQIVRSNQEDKNKSYEDEEAYTAVEGFLDLVLRRKIRKNIKSKTSYSETLLQIAKKEDNNRDYRTISFVMASLLSILTTFLVMLSGFNPVTAAFIIIIILILFAYTISCFTVNKLSKSEKEELKQLPKDFKKYILGGYTTFNEEFFSHQISSYIDSFFKDSVVYPYVKAKYTKIESGNSITNE